MANYTLINKRGTTKSKNINDIHLNSDCEIYIEGDDIDFELIRNSWTFNSQRIKLYIKNYNIDELQLSINKFKFSINKLSFVECNIKKLDLFNYNNDEGEINFQNCTFGEVELLNNKIKYLKIENTNIDSIYSNEDSDFKNIEISTKKGSGKKINSLHIDTLKNCQELRLVNYNFDEINLKHYVSLQKFVIDGCIIESLNYIDSGFRRLSISDSTVNNSSIKAKHEVSKIDLRRSKLNIDFDLNLGTDIYQALCLHISKLSDSTVKFTNGSFYNSNIEIFNSKLKLDFINCSFLKLEKISFKENNQCKTKFSNCVFDNELKFVGKIGNTNSLLSFEESIFSKFVQFDKSNFKQLVFDETVFKDEVLIPTSSIQPNEIVNTHNSVWRILKDQSLQRNDKIKAIEYKKNEYQSYHKILKSKEYNSDRFILFWNNISNKHGLSFWQGIKFTIITSIILFGLFLWSISSKLEFTCSVGPTIKYFFKFLNIADFNYKAFDIEYNWQYLILYISKIIIAYGYYQTITAFRKFGKN